MFKKELTLLEKITKEIKKNNDAFKIQKEIVGMIKSGVGSVSKAIAESIVLGKELNATFKALAQQILINIIAKTIERITLLGIEKILTNTILKDEAEKDNLIRKQNTNLKRQLALKTALSFMGGGVPFFAKGGAVSKGKPVVVGERGPELFVPNSTGQIQQNARGTGGGTVNVNFNIDAIDSSSFNNVLVENRGVITSIINNALNEKGRRELV